MVGQRGGKKTTSKNNFYLTVLEELKHSTNLQKIQEKLNLSKQNLNYYLRQLVKKGFIFSKGQGWYELTESGKNPTKYGIFLKEDDVRGHAYVWEVEIEKIPENWKNRIEILKEKEVNFKLVGALKNVPRIKVLGRKVWLCNDHIRIFDTEKSSYYGDNAIESRKNSKLQAMRLVHTLESKLGIRLNPDKIKFKKEHYALIRNSLAINQNQKGIIMRIKDENGEEWLLIDDSLGEGGELETIGKKAFKTNPLLQNWWNDYKKDAFKTTPTKINHKFREQEEMIDALSKNNKTLLEQNLVLQEVLNGMNKNLLLLTKKVMDLEHGR